MPKSRAQPGISNTNGVFVIVPKEKSLPALVAGLLPADQRCSRSASCRFAIDGTAPCDGSDFPAFGRRRLQPQLRTQRFPREVLPLAPAALPTWHTACAFTTIFIRPGLPRMVLQRICPIRLE